MKTSVLFFIVLSMAVCSTCHAQKARFVGESLLISDGTQRIQLPKLIGQHTEYHVVHAVQKRAGDYFVVIGVSEFSRGYPPRGGECGAGIESHIDWLHVHDGKIVERESGLYESCQQNRFDYSINWQDGVLHWNTEGQRRVEESGHTTFIPVSYSWTFDPAHPDKGIEEHSEDITPSPHTNGLVSQCAPMNRGSLWGLL